MVRQAVKDQVDPEEALKAEEGWDTGYWAPPEDELLEDDDDDEEEDDDDDDDIMTAILQNGGDDDEDDDADQQTKSSSVDISLEIKQKQFDLEDILAKHPEARFHRPV